MALGSFLVWIVILIILLYGVNISREGQWQEGSLDLSHSKDLLGYFAILIVVHHLVQNLISSKNIDVGILSVFENMGVCFVGVFFFFSGYGLIKSLKTKPDYLNGFFKKRIVRIIIPFYVVNTFFVIVTNMMGLIEKQEMPLCIAGIFMANDHMWYLVEIILLYSLFYLNFKKSSSEEEAFLKMFVQISVIITGSLLIGHGPFWFQGEWWYNSTLLFFIGMVIARFEKPVISYAKRNYKILTFFSAAAFIIFHALTVNAINTAGYWTEYDEKITWMESILDKVQVLTLQIPMIIAFVILIVLLGLKVRVGNKVLSFLGTISLEIYITHRLWIILFDKMKNPLVFLVSVLVCAVILGAVFHVIDSLALKILPVAVPMAIGFIINVIKRVAALIADTLRKTIKIKKGSTWGFIFIAPFFIFYALFSLVPLISTIVNSFFENYRSGLIQIGPNFVGFENYEKLFSTGDFWKYLGNTMILWIFAFIPQILVSLALAFWLSDRKLIIKGSLFYKTVIYLPGIIMAAAMSSFMGSMFSLNGPVNTFMTETIKVWKEPFDFFASVAGTRGLIIFLVFLMSFGSSTLLLMAAMLRIDESLYEAAKVDGAPPFVVFRRITMPLIQPVFFYVLITSLISGMQLYDIPAVMNGGNPVRSSFTMVMYLRNNLHSSNYGIGGAISTLMLLVTGALSIVMFVINRKGENR